jgi:Holliday junction DNA helicase RuvB
VDDDVPAEIARRARGTPRIGLRILQSARRVCRSEGEAVVTLDHLLRACSLDRIDRRGLTGQEQAYLELLGDGPGRLNVLASCLGMPSRTVSEVVEPFLIRSGLVVKDGSGRRTLTQAGLDHLYTSRAQGV